ncbi:uncharacterized protein CBO05P1_242 [Clostridium botulinum B str. Osaka05]|uniref:Uncharacterized protein n=1 Tax=Clostridium botulinum B str. Osaka05 TaxID=1407017 RepID=A0A060N3A0_CLOBO|nr:hypothetical protein [Clostridium botulinum]BAO04961.1 uncharacterized protein CBO05P1_242 [Clostridium botulinum B str. Osaka05]
MIKLKNTYLGYTNNLKVKSMQKAKIEKNLDNFIRSDKIMYIQKDFILNRIKEGFEPCIVENYSYYSKRLDGMTKPKTDYRLTNKEGTYYTINKTLYKFGKYIIDNNFIDDTIRESFILEEQQEKAQQKQLQKEKELQEQHEKELKEKQKQEFKKWIMKEIENYNNIDKLNLAKEIFSHENGRYLESVLKKLLIFIENINNPLCKEELISWLHIGNKASKKVFYHITGIKLPITNKETTSLLEKLNSNDYIGMIEYKPRKTPQQQKELKTFYKMIRIPEPHFEESLGEELKKYGLTMYLTKTNNNYSLTEVKSGCDITGGKTKIETLNNLKNFVNKYGIDRVKNMIEEQIKQNGLSPLFRNTQKAI